jgi:transposase
MGLDCHRNFSRVTARDAEGRVVWRQRLEHGDRAGLRERLRSWPAGVPVVLEGTFGWGWVSDELREAGLDPHLASSRKTAAWRDARGMAKSNRVDADLLSELWSQQRPRWWEVWLAPQEVRDQREWLRYRMTLVRMQTGIKNRVHATLHRHGVPHEFSDLFGAKGWAFLGQLASDDDVTLRDSARRTLAGYLKLLGQVRQQIAEVTRELRRQLRRSEQGELWRSLPGVSWVLAYTILAEVGRVERFRDGRHLCSYGLVAPVADDSGDEGPAGGAAGGPAPLGRHVGHVGRVTLKWALVAAARGAVRKSAYFRAAFDRRTDGGKRDRGRGYIAVARELCRVGYSCVKGRRRYSETRPPREQQRPREQPKSKEESKPNVDLLVRECVGPDRPLAAAAVL